MFIFRKMFCKTTLFNRNKFLFKRFALNARINDHDIRTCIADKAFETLLHVRRQFDDLFVSARRENACGKNEEKEFVKATHNYLLPLIMAARSAPLKFVFSLRAATIAVSDFWQAIMRL